MRARACTSRQLTSTTVPARRGTPVPANNKGTDLRLELHEAELDLQPPGQVEVVAVLVVVVVVVVVLVVRLPGGCSLQAACTPGGRRAPVVRALPHVHLEGHTRRAGRARARAQDETLSA